jgi:hypothetical protein
VAGFIVGVYSYSISAVKQDDFVSHFPRRFYLGTMKLIPYSLSPTWKTYCRLWSKDNR